MYFVLLLLISHVLFLFCSSPFDLDEWVRQYAVRRCCVYEWLATIYM